MTGRPRRRRAWASAAGLIAAVLIATAAAARFADSVSNRPVNADGLDVAAEAATLPAPHRPAFRLGYVPPLPADSAASRWSPVLQVVDVRARPSPHATAVGRLKRRTSLGTTNIVLVLGHARAHQQMWVNVSFPASGSNDTGWVPREAIGGYRFVHTRMVVDREALTATLLRDGRALFRADIGVGTDEFPTPGGSFYISEKLTNFHDPFYGPVAFGTSARSTVLTDWPDGGSIGIHGTNHPELLPGRVSHGCIRMRNEDILLLSRLMPVGTPVTIT